jgi:hypothetical protein
LDKNLREEMQVELRALQRQLGLTTVFVTHDQEEALTMSDFVAVMRGGVIEQLGGPREIYERPATDFVATFLGASNLFQATVLGPDGDGTMVEVPGGRFRIADQGLAAGASRPKAPAWPRPCARRSIAAPRSRCSSTRPADPWLRPCRTRRPPGSIGRRARRSWSSSIRPAP